MADTGLDTRGPDDIRFVRDEMIAPTAPPLRETGAILWVRTNLVSGPLNVVLTILALWLLWSALRDFLPWAVRGIWSAESLSGCRAIRDQLYAAGTEVACWSVITDRWRQLVFGFYPASQTWRPPLALATFLVAILPVLFAALPRRLLWLTAAAPFLCYWLLWGGLIWGPVTVALGLGLVGLAVAVVARQSGTLWGVAAGIVLVLVLFFDPLAPLSRLLDAPWLARPLPLLDAVTALLVRAAPIGLPAVASDQFGGFTLSVVIGISAICLSLPLGILLALGRRSELFIISKVSIAYIEVIRGVPLIVWLFTAQLLLNYFLPKGTNFDLMLRVIIMATLFAAAYIAEVVRGGLAALAKGQFEAGDSLGLDYWSSMRHIVLPQALKISIPGIVNTFIGLFKDTTLVAFIGMYDPIGLASAIRASTDWSGVYWEIYVFIAAVFFAFCFSMSRYSIWLERRLERDHR